MPCRVRGSCCCRGQAPSRALVERCAARGGPHVGRDIARRGPVPGTQRVPAAASAEEARGGIDVETTHVDHEDADHREGPIVKGGLAVRRLVLRGERIPIEVGERGLAATDFHVALIGQRVRAGVGPEQAGEVEQVAVRGRRSRRRSGRKAARVGHLRDPDRRRKPAKRVAFIVSERIPESREAAERRPVGRGQLREPLRCLIVQDLDRNSPPENPRYRSSRGRFREHAADHVVARNAHAPEAAGGHRGDRVLVTAVHHLQIVEGQRPLSSPSSPKGQTRSSSNT